MIDYEPGDRVVIINTGDDYSFYRGMPATIMSRPGIVESRYGAMMAIEILPDMMREEDEGQPFLIAPQLLKPMRDPPPFTLTLKTSWDKVHTITGWDPRQKA